LRRGAAGLAASRLDPPYVVTDAHMPA
jgi:hypothetical protein